MFPEEPLRATSLIPSEATVGSVSTFQQFAKQLHARTKHSTQTNNETLLSAKDCVHPVETLHLDCLNDLIAALVVFSAISPTKYKNKLQ